MKVVLKFAAPMEAAKIWTRVEALRAMANYMVPHQPCSDRSIVNAVESFELEIDIVTLGHLIGFRVRNKPGLYAATRISARR